MSPNWNDACTHVVANNFRMFNGKVSFRFLEPIYEQKCRSFLKKLALCSKLVSANNKPTRKVILF